MDYITAHLEAKRLSVKYGVWYVCYADGKFFSYPNDWEGAVACYMSGKRADIWFG